MRAEFTRLIADRRAELEARLTAAEERLASIRLARSGATDDDEHDPEGSTLSTEWSRAEGQRTDVIRELADLDAASDRVGAGTYGVCAACGNPIPLERLRLLPAAALCVPCASRV
ncbi:TraR/DksA C4-type zinc finger protein [Microbacterium sp. zg.B48]|uniref:TraR/DksA family transcriptional regulator n=1 Tax=Microbacterium sp. zg.B48 TaxID=2969408 RepID=UPI00214C57D6|nr:TraR/DksA C4-type zinc finger protein [Microbacterium sp. zg.B48]MCR2763483.1 TraR/DksA C4-type zinc finger protein [Microbacterium sp. zg.B48]